MDQTHRTQNALKPNKNSKFTNYRVTATYCSLSDYPFWLNKGFQSERQRNINDGDISNSHPHPHPHSYPCNVSATIKKIRQRYTQPLSNVLSVGTANSNRKHTFNHPRYYALFSNQYTRRLDCKFTQNGYINLYQARRCLNQRQSSPTPTFHLSYHIVLPRLIPYLLDPLGYSGSSFLPNAGSPFY